MNCVFRYVTLPELVRADIALGLPSPEVRRNGYCFLPCDGFVLPRCWQPLVTCLPCRHVVCVIDLLKSQVAGLRHEEYAQHFFTADMHRIAYQPLHMLQALSARLNAKSECVRLSLVSGTEPVVQPAVYAVRQQGRPKQSRIRGWQDAESRGS
jgi:hypothetical protein